MGSCAWLWLGSGGRDLVGGVRQGLGIGDTINAKLPTFSKSYIDGAYWEIERSNRSRTSGQVMFNFQGYPRWNEGMASVIT